MTTPMKIFPAAAPPLLDVAVDDHCRVLAPMSATPLFPTYNSTTLSLKPSAMNFMAVSRLAYQNNNDHLILDIDECPMRYAAELPSKM